MENIHVTVDDSMDAMAEPIVMLTFRDGYQAERMVPRGHRLRRAPLAAQSHRSQVSGTCCHEPVGDAVDTLWHMMGNLEQIDDCARIATLMIGHADSLPTFR